MIALWLYLAGAFLTLGVVLLLCGRPRDGADVAALIALVALWPLVLVAAIHDAWEERTP